MEHAARAKALLKLGHLRIVRVLGLLFGIKVIKVAKEFVEAMHRRQEFVLVAQMILPELTDGVTMRLEQLGHGGIGRAQTDIGARHTDLGEARTDRILPSDKCSSAGGTT